VLLLARAAVEGAGVVGVTDKVGLGPRDDSSERRFVDAHGRERVFHGTNVVVKGPPWLPRLDEFDPLTSLVEKDFEHLQEVGINLLRLGVMWAGAEPARGQYNESYFHEIRRIVDMAASHGMHVLLDMHQDLLSEAFCGEGIPSWAVVPPKHHWDKFPVPLEIKPTSPAEDGFPTRQACKRIFATNPFAHGWASGQGAFATGYAYEALYTNMHNLTEAWGAFWAKTASEVLDLDNVLGFELINEPFAGNPFKNPLIMARGWADSWRLQPAYDTLVRHIRQVDTKTLVFFAGVTWDNNHPAGFKHAPGGPQEANRSVLAYHYYVPPNGEDFDAYFKVKRQDAKRLGTGLMMTESCCNHLYERAIPSLSAAGHSWIHWEWKDWCREDAASLRSSSQQAAWGSCKTGFGAGPWGKNASDRDAPEKSVMLKLATPYAPVVAGTLEGTWWNASAGIFAMRFRPDPLVHGPSEVFLGERLNFPLGFDVTVDPEETLVVEHPRASHRLLLTPRQNMSAVVSVLVKVTRRNKVADQLDTVLV
jgi:endoglycosylceramidase